MHTLHIVFCVPFFFICEGKGGLFEGAYYNTQMGEVCGLFEGAVYSRAWINRGNTVKA